MGGYGGKTLRTVVKYVAIGALLLAALFAAEVSGPDIGVGGAEPDARAGDLAPVGSHNNKTTRQCDDEDLECANSAVSGSLDGDCPVGTTLVAKFEVKGGSYVFEQPAGNEDVVTLSNTSLSGGNWSSTIAIVAVVVKAGEDAKVDTFDPGLFSGSFSNSGMLNNGGQVPDISNVRFCA